jgi:RNA polymerase sigma-70 factor (ECF subfamily)
MSSLIEIHNILKAFKEGREEAFNYFFNSCYKPLYFFASRYVKDEAAAEDVITESFIKLWDKREIFETESGIKGYLYKSVYNACLRWLQQQQRKTVHTKSYTGQINTTEQSYLNDIIKAETIHQLHIAISQLPSQCKKIFTKLYIEGKQVSEIAKEMNLTISTIKNQKARGLKLLKPKLTN